MWDLKKKLKNRISGEAAYFLKKDIESLFSSKETTTLGLTWFFLGRKQYLKQIAKYLNKYYDTSQKHYDFDGIKIPKSARDVNVDILCNEALDILAPHLGGICGYSPKTIANFGEGPYEYKEITIDKGDVVIDAGANIGIFSALAGKKIGADSGGLVHAYEPVPNTIKILKETAKLNDNIKIVPMALSDSIGTVDISLHGNNIGRSSIVITQQSCEKISVKTTTIDAYVNDNNLTKLDFIKADVEGAERLLLKGAKGVLKECAPKLAICTYHLPDDPVVIRDLILSANDKYVIYQKNKKLYAFVPK